MNTRKLHLTILDDDKNFLEVLSMSLERYCLANTFSAEKEMNSFLMHYYTDAILLDLNLGETDGFQVCRSIRASNSRTPIFFFTNEMNRECISKGFESGGVDYFTKSMPIDELMTRVEQRVRLLSPKEEGEISFSDLKVNLKSKLAYMGSEEIKLTPKEYAILKTFLERPNQIISKQDMLAHLWEGTHVDANNIDTHMFNLRKKIKNSLAQISTEKGRGFVLRA